MALKIEVPGHLVSLVEPFQELLAAADRQAKAVERGEAIDGAELAERMQQMRDGALAIIRNRIQRARDK